VSVWPTARGYAAKGMPTFPCRPGDKPPLTRRGLHDASCDLGQLRAWERQWPNANLGLPTGRVSGYLVVDVDCKAGVPGLASLWAAERELGKLPRELVSRTPSGGYHIWFRMPAVEVRNSAGKLGELEAPGVDIRAEGGYVLVPPSQVGTGCYEWRKTHGKPELPPAWVEALMRKPRPPVEPWEPRNDSERSATERWCLRALNGTFDKLSAEPSGGRNHALMNASVRLGSLLHYGAFTRSDIHALLAAVCARWGSTTPGKDRATVERGIGYGISAPKFLPAFDVADSKTGCGR
jgi:hypothetical protein